MCPPPPPSTLHTSLCAAAAHSLLALPPHRCSLQLSDTTSSRWYLLIECLPHVLGSIARRFMLADVLGLELFANDVVSGFANSAIFVSE